MTTRESAVTAVTPKGVAGFAILLLVLAAFFGFLNTQKMKTLRATVATAQAARDTAKRGIREKLNPSAVAAVEDQGKVAQAENRAGKAEAELAHLNRSGVIDAIMTDDVDTLIFGALVIIKKFVLSSRLAIGWTLTMLSFQPQLKIERQ